MSVGSLYCGDAPDDVFAAAVFFAAQVSVTLQHADSFLSALRYPHQAMQHIGSAVVRCPNACQKDVSDLRFVRQGLENHAVFTALNERTHTDTGGSEEHFFAVSQQVGELRYQYVVFYRHSVTTRKQLHAFVWYVMDLIYIVEPLD